MNRSVITHRGWNWSWQNGGRGKYGCCTARTDEELTQRDCRDKAALPRQGSYLFRIKVTAFHWNKMGAVCNLTARQDTAEWCFC